MKKPRCHLWGPLLAAVAACGHVSAQTPAAMASPNLALYTNGTVYASARMDDGGVVFGGEFSQVNGVARSNLARLKPDGTLDPDWHPATDYPVMGLVNDGGGHIYVGGNFQNIGGLVRPHVARFASNGAGDIDLGWSPSQTCINFNSLATDSTGDVFVAGYNCYTNAKQTGIIKLSGGTSASVSTWSVLTDAQVVVVTVDSNNNLYLGGDFGHVGGQTRPHLAKVSGLGSGQLDPTWNPAPANGTGIARIYSLALDNRGNLIVGGSFNSIGGQTRSNIARVSATGAGSADTSWNPSADAAVKALTIDGSGRIYAGGIFTSIGGRSGAALARLSSGGSGSADAGWLTISPSISGEIVNSLSANGDGTIYVGGFFSMIGNQERHSFASISSNGDFGPSTDTTTPGGIVNAIALQPNGGLILGGYFSGSGNFVRGNALRLQPDGSIDPNWSPSTDAPNQIGVEAVAATADGSVYLGGEFSRIDGKAQSGIAKLTPGGTLDPAWNSTADEATIASDGYGVRAIATANDGSVYIGGDFTAIGRQPQMCLARISSAGAVDPTWNPFAGVLASGPVNIVDGVTAIALDSDGSVYVASDVYTQVPSSYASDIFKIAEQGSGSIDPNWKPNSTNLEGIPYALLLDGKGSLYAGGFGLTKLSTIDGSADSTWSPGPFGRLSFTDYRYNGSSPVVYALALDGTGGLYIGGAFSGVLQTATSSSDLISVVDQRSRPYLAKLAESGATIIDPTWNPDPDNVVYALATGANGLLYAGGSFSQIGGQSRSGIAALSQASASNPILPDNLDQFGWTGAWYNPATSGQGLLLQIIPSSTPLQAGTFFGAWFTYDFYGEGGAQRWYTFQGPVDGTSKTAAVSVLATEYSANTFAAVSVGNAIVSFQDCTHGNVTYSVADLPAWGYAGAYDSFPITRLGSNISCTPNGDTSYGSDYALSGIWYDQVHSHNGLVFLVDPVSKMFFAGWFLNVYPQSVGVQAAPTSTRWYTLQSTYLPGATSMENIPIYSTQGGALDYPLPPTSSVVGTANLTFNNCDSATLTYTFSSGPDSGGQETLNLSRGVGKPASCNP